MSKRAVELELKYNGREKRLELDEEKIIVGRSSALKASVSDCLNVSREHLKIELNQQNEIWITDLSSTNGTFYEGRRIEPNHPVQYSGAPLCIGPSDEGVYIKIRLKSESVSVTSVSTQEEPLVIERPAVYQAQSFAMPPLVDPIEPIESSRLIQAQLKKPDADFDSGVIELALKKKEMGELSRQVEDLGSEINRLHHNRESEQNKLNEVLARVSEQEAHERAISDRVRELLATESASKNLALTLQDDIDRKQQEVLSVQKSIEDINKRRVELEEIYFQDETKIVALREKLKQQESDLHKKSLEVQSETERLKSEFEYLRKKTKLDSDNVEAEFKLMRAQMEREVEEARTKKVSIDREVEALQERFNKLDSSVKSLSSEKLNLEILIEQTQATLSSLRASTSEVDAKKRQIESEVEILGHRAQEAAESTKRQLQSAETNAREIVDVARLEANRLIEEASKRLEGEREVAMSEVQRFRSTTENELREREQKLLSDIAQDRKEASESILKEKNEWKIEHEYLKNKAIKDYEAATKVWKEELNRTKEKDAEELRLWLASEEKKVRSRLSSDMDNFVHQVSSRALTEIPKDHTQTMEVGALLFTLENSLKNALTREASEHGSFNPHLKQQKKTFWKKTASVAATLLVTVLSLIYGPSFVSEQLARLKIENKQQNDQFMRDVREQRERMLALQLQPRLEFQDSYVDNILYNSGYLAMKLDAKLKEEWTVVLSKFFFDELLFDDRKVVEYMPIETALIRELADINQVLNKRNFDVNVSQMKTLEQSKTEEMWLLVGGRDNWAKLRNAERDFYEKHVASVESASRMPASVPTTLSPARSKF
jgi:hypothetical protein